VQAWTEIDPVRMMRRKINLKGGAIRSRFSGRVVLPSLSETKMEH
jgi:hypothetical protein